MGNNKRDDDVDRRAIEQKGGVLVNLISFSLGKQKEAEKKFTSGSESEIQLRILINLMGGLIMCMRDLN
jgi:hypothetical protein